MKAKEILILSVIAAASISLQACISEPDDQEPTYECICSYSDGLSTFIEGYDTGQTNEQQAIIRCDDQAEALADLGATDISCDVALTQ